MPDLDSPNLLASTLHPVSQLVDTLVPTSQSLPHSFDLSLVENLRLDPLYPCYLIDLVDCSFQKTQAQGLHDQVLDLVGLNLGFLSNGSKGHGTVVWGTAEDGLSQCGKTDLLVQEHVVLFEQIVLVHVSGENIVSAEVAAVECDDQVTKPGVWGVFQGVEDGVEQQFSEVVDGVGNKCCDRKVVGQSLALFDRERFEVDAGKV